MRINLQSLIESADVLVQYAEHDSQTAFIKNIGQLQQVRHSALTNKSKIFSKFASATAEIFQVSSISSLTSSLLEDCKRASATIIPIIHRIKSKPIVSEDTVDHSCTNAASFLQLANSQQEAHIQSVLSSCLPLISFAERVSKLEGLFERITLKFTQNAPYISEPGDKEFGLVVSNIVSMLENANLQANALVNEQLRSLIDKLVQIINIDMPNRTKDIFKQHNITPLLTMALKDCLQEKLDDIQQWCQKYILEKSDSITTQSIQQLIPMVYDIFLENPQSIHLQQLISKLHTANTALQAAFDAVPHSINKEISNIEIESVNLNVKHDNDEGDTSTVVELQEDTGIMIDSLPSLSVSRETRKYHRDQKNRIATYLREINSVLDENLAFYNVHSKVSFDRPSSFIIEEFLVPPLTFFTGAEEYPYRNSKEYNPSPHEKVAIFVTHPKLNALIECITRSLQTALSTTNEEELLYHIAEDIGMKDILDMYRQQIELLLASGTSFSQRLLQNKNELFTRLLLGTNQLQLYVQTILLTEKEKYKILSTRSSTIAFIDELCSKVCRLRDNFFM